MSLIGEIVKVGETVLFHHDADGNAAGFDVSPAIVTAIHEFGDGEPQKITAEVFGVGGNMLKRFISFVDDIDDDAHKAGGWFDKLEAKVDSVVEPDATAAATTTDVPAAKPATGSLDPTADQIDDLIDTLSPTAKAALLAQLQASDPTPAETTSDTSTTPTTGQTTSGDSASSTSTSTLPPPPAST